MPPTVVLELLAIFVVVAIGGIGWIVDKLRWLRPPGIETDPARTRAHAGYDIFMPALLFRTPARIDFGTMPWGTWVAVSAADGGRRDPQHPGAGGGAAVPGLPGPDRHVAGARRHPRHGARCCAAVHAQADRACRTGARRGPLEVSTSRAAADGQRDDGGAAGGQRCADLRAALPHAAGADHDGHRAVDLGLGGAGRAVAHGAGVAGVPRMSTLAGHWLAGERIGRLRRTAQGRVMPALRPPWAAKSVLLGSTDGRWLALVPCLVTGDPPCSGCDAQADCSLVAGTVRNRRQQGCE